jgi:hypothetical protein
LSRGTVEQATSEIARMMLAAVLAFIAAKPSRDVYMAANVPYPQYRRSGALTPVFLV